MTADVRCPTCGVLIPQFGGQADADIVLAHEIAEHGESEQPNARRDLTYRDAIAILVALVLVVLLVSQVIR